MKKKLQNALIDELAHAAWGVLNHDNDPTQTDDPCHAANWKSLTGAIVKVLKKHTKRIGRKEI